MQFVGKILVVLQLILSVLFMAFAGVVYQTQMKWRDEALTQKANVAKHVKELSDTRADFDRFRTQAEGKIKDADTKRAVVEAANTGLQNDKAQLTKQVADANVAQKTSGEQAVIAGAEAQARNEESL